jgi:hypothetical protein
MALDINQFTQALRAGEIDKFLRLPGILLKEYYTSKEIAKLGADDLMDLLLYAFNRSDLKKKDIFYLQALEAVAIQEPFFQSGEIGAVYIVLCQAAVFALATKRAGICLPKVEKDSFDVLMTEKKEVITKAIAKYGPDLMCQLSTPFKTNLLSEWVERLIQDVKQYKKETDIASRLKASLCDYFSLLQKSPQKDKAFMARQSLAVQFYELLEPRVLILFDELTEIQAFILALKEKIKKIVSERQKGLEESALSIFYEKDFLLSITPCVLPMLESIKDETDESKACSLMSAWEKKCDFAGRDIALQEVSFDSDQKPVFLPHIIKKGPLFWTPYICMEGDPPSLPLEKETLGYGLF